MNAAQYKSVYTRALSWHSLLLSAAQNLFGVFFLWKVKCFHKFSYNLWNKFHVLFVVIGCRFGLLLR